MKVTSEGEDKPTCSQYVLRGLIVYYGRHYWAYFYSHKFDRWYQFNDESLSEIGNWKAVREKAITSRCIPRTVFYERQDIIVNLLTEGGLSKAKEQDLIYFADSKMKTNYFWLNGPKPQRQRDVSPRSNKPSVADTVRAEWNNLWKKNEQHGQYPQYEPFDGSTRDDCTLF